MMFYEKKLALPKLSKKIKTFDVLNEYYGKKNTKSTLPYSQCIGFQPNEKGLKSGYGVEVYQNQLENYIDFGEIVPIKLYEYNANEQGQLVQRLLIYAKDGKMYFYNLNGNGSITLLSDTVFSQAPKGCFFRNGQNEDLFILTAEEGTYYLLGEVMTKIEDVSLDEICFFRGRLIGINRKKADKILFSKPLDPTDFYYEYTRGIYISLPDGDGKVLKMISFKDAVYFFRERGITRLTMGGDPLSFSLKKIETSFGKIYEKTVMLCGDKVVFLTEDGICAFDGESTIKIAHSFYSQFDFTKNTECVGGVYEGKYFLSITLKNNSKIVLICDIANDIFWTMDIEANDFFSFNKKLLFFWRGQLCCFSHQCNYLGNPIYKIWDSGFSDFGVYGRKLLRSIRVKGMGELFVCVYTKQAQKGFCLQLDKEKIQSIFPCLKNDKFGLRIESEEDCMIESITVELNELKEEKVW